MGFYIGQVLAYANLIQCHNRCLEENKLLRKPHFLRLSSRNYILYCEKEVIIWLTKNGEYISSTKQPIRFKLNSQNAEVE